MFRKQKTNLKKNISKQNTHFFLFHSWACLPSLRDTNRLFLHCRRQVRGPSLRRTTDQKCHSRGKNTSSNNHKNTGNSQKQYITHRNTELVKSLSWIRIRNKSFQIHNAGNYCRNMRNSLNTRNIGTTQYNTVYVHWDMRRLLATFHSLQEGACTMCHV